MYLWEFDVEVKDAASCQSQLSVADNAKTQQAWKTGLVTFLVTVTKYLTEAT